MAEWDETADFVIVGSGGGSMCAALACKDLGKRALILEKTDKIGGSTAMSGGILWIPASTQMKRAGVNDTPEQAMAYLQALVPDEPGSTLARKQAYLRTGPKMMDWLEGKGVRLIYCDGWSDYHTEITGAQARGRSISMGLFDVRKLGPWRNKLRANVLPLPAEGTEGHRMVLMARTFTGFATAAKVMVRKFISNILGTEFVAFGGAIQAWMLSLSIKVGIDIRTETPVKDFIRENGRITGVIAEQNGREIRIQAHDGVLIDCGGFARNEEMRKTYGPQPSSTRWTSANPGDTGEIILAAQKAGGVLHGMDRAIWCISSILPDGRVGIHANELGKPHVILVDKNGKRFTDEAASYMETGQKIYANNAVPCWAIMDSRHRARYPWAHIPPRFSPPDWVSSGYMKKAQNIAELAKQCGIDAAGLEATVTRYNSFAETGKDLDFKRGERAYDRYFGDPTNHPNPNIGAISEAPFYAVEMFPGDVGTYGGLVTDEFGRVLDENGAPLEGLYATGNSTASVTGARYPGAGASIGASFVFGYRAARHASGANAD